MEKENNKQIDSSKLTKADFDRLSGDEKLDLFARSYRVPQKRTKAEALEMLRSRIDNKPEQKPVRNLRIYWSAAASIALIVLLTTIYFYQPTSNEIIASRGQHIDYTLPDGSKVAVNAESKISFSESKFTKKRMLELEGEAYFSVQKGSPFVVKTHLGTVEVLGTTLNVYARNEKMSVSCLTGKIQVTAGEQHIILTPGEKADLISGVLQKTSDISPEQMAEWRSGQFNFESVPLISIFDEIERQFDVDITSQGLETRLFTGGFSNKNLQEALETLSMTMNLEYEINGQKIEIRAKK